MQFLPFSSITIPADRQRKEFEETALAELSRSITEIGLLHPIVVREEAGQTMLVAGERRLKCLTLLDFEGTPYSFNNTVVPAGHVPVVTLGELSPLAACQAELEENAIRANLTWQEEAEAYARFQELQTMRAESAQQPAPTLTDLTRELSAVTGKTLSSTNVLQKVVVAGHLDKKEVRSAKSASEAFKVLKRIESRAEDQTRAMEVGKVALTSRFVLHHIDCLDWMADLAASSPSARKFDCILTDPPYGINAQNFDDSGGRMSVIDNRYEDSPENWERLMQAWCPLSYKITADSAHAYVFCDISKFHRLTELMTEAGWKVFRTPIIVVRRNGRVPLPHLGPRRDYDLCLFANKGKKETLFTRSDVIQATDERQTQHGSEKSIEAYAELLSRSCRPGDWVIDPFTGSGTIFPAAARLSLYATGIEADQGYFGLAYSRMQAAIEGETK